MMRITLIILLLIPAWICSQTVIFDTSEKAISVDDLASQTFKADSLLRSDSIEISLVKIKPYCESSGDCYQESIINDTRDPNARISDSLYGELYFTGVRKELIDTTVSLNQGDYNTIMANVLKGESAPDPNQIVNWCYNPRHAVLIKDTKGTIIVIYEICFECNNSKIGLIKSEMINDSANRMLPLFKKYGLIND